MNAYIKALTTQGYVSAEDVLRMRRRVFGDQVVDHEEMADLLKLAAMAPDGDPSWQQFLGEAMADFFIRQGEPRGYMSEENGAFLVRCLDRPDAINPAVLDALVHMVRHAHKVPQPVIDFGLEAIRAHVLADAVINADEVERVRAFLFAAGGAGNVAITRQEAAFLFDLNDAAYSANNHPSWADLFMKAVGNYLMAHIGYQPPTRREALRREAWLKSPKADITGFFGRMTQGGFKAVIDAYQWQHPQAAANDRREIEAGYAAVLTAAETDWLVSRIKRDGLVNDAEEALITHLQVLQGETPLPGKLAALV
ncbi:hypothetical protein [Aquisalinus flavus]|uniref:Uncharacterized protein n=1 Tax=Aquisalinus flavus TaxID=1526572 RepID=A0A8J2Y6U1_9PROT|nr:hypothetical protein [Aquisalinus flavus]MBD0425639.1 hypothetical protein [Aquisalinus flavus]UNE48745.1 hypothetical protein FF099_12130 [Aquisalinus flavus]GGD14433.1 hypothetical protein GCM10011342_24030 [Aquisalinus flavus]